MSTVITGHCHSDERNGDGCVKILDAGFEPLFAVTGLMSRYRLCMLETIPEP